MGEIVYELYLSKAAIKIVKEEKTHNTHSNQNQQLSQRKVPGLPSAFHLVFGVNCNPALSLCIDGCSFFTLVTN